MPRTVSHELRPARHFVEGATGYHLHPARNEPLRVGWSLARARLDLKISDGKLPRPSLGFCAAVRRRLLPVAGERRT